MNYDDHNNYNENKPEEQVSIIDRNKEEIITVPAGRQKKSRSFLSHIISGVSGGAAVVALGGFMLTADILPGYVNQSAPATEVQSSITNSDGTTVTQTASPANASLETAIQQASEAVVGINNIQNTDIFSESQAAGTGSGVIYKKEDGKAYVVTNNHVVEGAASVEVVMPDETTLDAKVLGTDPLTDLAVLEIDGSNVEHVISLGSSDSLAIGETAIAIGNPLGLEFAGSVTQGIISGLDRSVETDSNQDGTPDWVSEVIQTDAAINPGNSGGALINSNGELIGINSMKIAQSAVEGIGFAIPIDYAVPIMEQLETNGEVDRPFIGISAIPLNQVSDQHRQASLNLPDEVENGVVLADIQADSPADQAGLAKYDVITEINGEVIEDMLDLKRYLYSETAIGEEVDITYYHDGQLKTTKLVLGNQ